MSIAAAIAFVAGTAIQVDSNKAAQRASKRASDTSSAAQKNADRAALRTQAREARREKARILQTSENLGTSGSSKEIGASGAIGNQVATSFANVGAQQLASAGISRETQKISDANTKAGYGAALAQAGSFAFGKSGGFDNLFSSSGGTQ